MTERYINSPNNLFFQLLDLQNTICKYYPPTKSWTHLKIFSEETEELFNKLKKSMNKDLENSANV